jgi:hypothetical protein
MLFMGEREESQSRNRDCDRIYAESIERGKKDIERLKQKLEVDLPEEARKEGAFPGWLRESNADSTPAQTGTSEASEVSWRNRAKRLREQLLTEQNNLESYKQQELQCEEEQKYNTGCRRRNCKVMYESRIKYSERSVAKLKQEYEIDLPDEARRAGAPPGWLRE